MHDIIEQLEVKREAARMGGGPFCVSRHANFSPRAVSES